MKTVFNLLRVARAKGMQHATNREKGATMRATDTQQRDLKALAQAVLERNKARNSHATETEKPCNKHPANEEHLLRVQEAEYLTLLARFWDLDDDPAATMNEARRLVDRLDELYRELFRQGRRVPVRLPVERRKVRTKEGSIEGKATTKKGNHAGTAPCTQEEKAGSNPQATVTG